MKIPKKGKILLKQIVPSMGGELLLHVPIHEMALRELTLRELR